MTTKKIKSNESNKEILEKELFEFHKKAKEIESLNTWKMDKKKLDYKQLEMKVKKASNQSAINLLSKLNKLNRENVEEIIRKGITFTCTGVAVDNNIANQILQLVPEEGEVIAEGKIEKHKGRIWIDDRTIDNFMFELEQEITPFARKNISKQIQIIIKQIGDGE